MRLVLAYLDPVTGSALVQVLLGAAAVIGLGYQYIRKGLQTVWSKVRRNAPETQGETTPVDV
jgi:hypothetical protein